MADWHAPQVPFDIPEVPDYIPRRLKPYLFILFVLIIQFSGGVYLAAAIDMVGTTALMQEDILMAGYASIVGLAINFAVIFRIKFRFSTRLQLLVSAAVLIAANVICAHTTSVPLLVGTCFVAGWFRMQATFACNSTIQLWLPPVRDMAVFFCYVYIIVDIVIQLSGIATVYTAFHFEWQYIHWIMSGLLALLMLMVMILFKPVRGPMFIPLLGIDWIGAALWSGFMLSFTFICVYGDFYDWWESSEIVIASALCITFLGLNLWRTTFLHHPYVSLQALRNRNVVRASCVYLVFFTLIATEHVFEHSYAAHILGFDETNMIDLNWYVFAGIVAGCGFTYLTFARRKWRYRHCFRARVGVSRQLLFPHRLRGGEGDVVCPPFHKRRCRGDHLHCFPHLHSAERVAVPGVSAGVDREWFHRRSDGSHIGAGAHRGVSATHNGKECCIVERASFRFYSGGRQCPDWQPLWDGAGSGPRGLDERNLRMAVDSLAGVGNHNRRKLRAGAAIRHIPQMGHYQARVQTCGKNHSRPLSIGIRLGL